MAPHPDPTPAPSRPLNFVLRVLPGTADRPWRAELRAEGGERREFTTPLALTRHLAALGAAPPATARLR